jgi:hypothetical protein
VVLPALLVTGATYMVAVSVTGVLLCDLTIDPEKASESFIKNNQKNNL